MKIGSIDAGKIILAPMAGVNCTAFRLLCKRAGASLIYTQMYHADFICHKHDSQGFDSVREFIHIQDKESPVTIQLVGHNPDTMKRAAGIIEPLADIIDINLGCCDTNIIKSGAGAHFAKYPEKIPDIIEPVLKTVKKPVTAKMRIGFDSQSINGVSVAVMLQKLGIAALAVHGRVATQKYSGKANWEIISHVKQKLHIPVIGNGDVKGIESFNAMIKRTNCDAVMIGRAAMGNPGVFSMNTEFINDFKEFMDLYEKYDGNKSFSELRTHALWHAKKARLGPKSRQKVMAALGLEQLKAALSLQ